MFKKITSSVKFVQLYHNHIQKQFINYSIRSCRKMSTHQLNDSISPEWLNRARAVVPKLSANRHKGQAGRIGIIGGSLEYTGAPYFAAISSLKVGADLVHVFCMRDAATVIKSYSPELIVHPILDAVNSIDLIQPWLERLHVLVIGPGLGRDETVLATVTQLIYLCKDLRKPLVIDADGLFLLSQNLNIIKDYNGIVLTPNVMEFERLFGKDGIDFDTKMNEVGIDGKTILEKGFTDKIYCTGRLNDYLELSGGGSGRRCGGQGDLLSGSIATFICWAIQHGDQNVGPVSCYAACCLVKELNRRAFADKGRSMIASDMIDYIHPVFIDLFEVR